MKVHDMYVTQFKESLEALYKDIKSDMISFRESADYNEEVEAVMIMQLAELRKNIAYLKSRENIAYLKSTHENRS